MLPLEALKVLFFIVFKHYKHIILGLEDVTPNPKEIHDEGICYIVNFYMMLLLSKNLKEHTIGRVMQHSEAFKICTL